MVYKIMTLKDRVERRWGLVLVRIVFWGYKLRDCLKTCGDRDSAANIACMRFSIAYLIIKEIEQDHSLGYVSAHGM